MFTLLPSSVCLSVEIGVFTENAHVLYCSLCLMNLSCTLIFPLSNWATLCSDNNNNNNNGVLALFQTSCRHVHYILKWKQPTSKHTTLTYTNLPPNIGSSDFSVHRRPWSVWPVGKKRASGNSTTVQASCHQVRGVSGTWTRRWLFPFALMP